MNFDEKQEFLKHCKELARNLEYITDEFIELQIGWIDDFEPSGAGLPVTIMLNDEYSWFGCFEKCGWNELVIWNNINKFIPAHKDYLVLNDLIDKAYRIKK